jgi:flagellar hook-basal body complex protein FliE
MHISSQLPGLGTLPNAAAEAARTNSAGGRGGDSFLKSLHGALEQVDQMQASAQEKVNGLLSGNGQDVHGAMIAVQQASLSFELMMQVRNKVVNAYSEISRLQF